MSNEGPPELDNDFLVSLIKEHTHYQKYHSPEYFKVLEAMRKVDRRNFVPDTLVRLAVVGAEELTKLHETAATSKAPDIGLSEEESRLLIANLRNSAINAVDSVRMHYAKMSNLVYGDVVLPIGHNQTCSEPSLVAFMAYFLDLKEGMKVLEVGSGCGYSSAITSHLIGDSGYLVTMEIIPELAELARRNLENHFGREGLERRLEVIVGDGSVGPKKDTPFDRIYLTAGVNSQSFDPSILAGQLNHNKGILLFPEEDGNLIKQIYERRELIDTKRYGNGTIGFVPLIG